MKTKKEPNSISKRIKEIRLEKNISQEEFGQSIGVTGAAICQIESGKNLPSTELILKIDKKYSLGLNLISKEKDKKVLSDEKSMEIQMINKNLTDLPLKKLKKIRQIIFLINEVSN